MVMFVWIIISGAKQRDPPPPGTRNLDDAVDGFEFLCIKVPQRAHAIEDMPYGYRNRPGRFHLAPSGPK